MRRVKPRDLMQQTVVALAALITVVGIGSVLAVMVAGKFGDTALGMKTGSMNPTINPGDLVITRSVSPRTVHPGDIITFRRPGEPKEIYTHRVSSVVYVGQLVQFHTKGDANPVADGWTVTYSGPAWKVTHVIPEGGYVLAVVQTRLAREVLAGCIFILAIWLLWPALVTPATRRPSHPPVVAGVR